MHTSQLQVLSQISQHLHKEEGGHYLIYIKVFLVPVVGKSHYSDSIALVYQGWFIGV